MTEFIPTRTIRNGQLAVTELGFGAATLGNLYVPISDEDVRAAVTAALECGIRYFDTAPYYGFGLSERRLGDALRGCDEAIISTKVGRLLAPDRSVHDDAERFGFYSRMPFRPFFDYSYDAVMRSYEMSLQRLGLPRIDVLYVHDIGRLTHGQSDAVHFEALTRGGGLRALEELRSTGDISGFGVGVNEIEACERVMDHARLDVILLAGRYTLLEQDALKTLLPRCLTCDTKIVAGGPYNSGILATGTTHSGPLHYNYEIAPPQIVERVRSIEAVCREHNVPLAAAALQFPLAHRAVASVIPGISNARRVAQTLKLYRAPIPRDFWLMLRERNLIAADAPAPETAS